MPEFWPMTLWLAAATFAIRLMGYALGQRLPAHGGWASALRALPGCLILSLVAVLLIGSGPPEWLAAITSAVVALVTRSLPLTMIAGIIAVLAARAVI